MCHLITQYALNCLSTFLKQQIKLTETTTQNRSQCHVMQRSRCPFKETNLTYLCYNVAIMSFVTLTQESVVVKPNHESAIILSDIIMSFLRFTLDLYVWDISIGFIRFNMLFEFYFVVIPTF